MKDILQLYRKLKKLFIKKTKPIVEKIYKIDSNEELIKTAKKLFPTGSGLYTITFSTGDTYRESGFINWERMHLYKHKSPYIHSDGSLWLGWDEVDGMRRSKVYDGETNKWFFLPPEKLAEMDLEKARKIFNDE